MKNKTLEFVKNMGISSLAFIGGGIAGAELSDLITDNETIISSVSTASQYVAALPIFLALHAHDNKNKYKKEGRWDKRLLVKDFSKITLSLGVAEIPYIFGRTLLMDYFLNKEFATTSASIYADLVCLPIYMGVAVPIAKKVGLIKD